MDDTTLRQLQSAYRVLAHLQANTADQTDGERDGQLIGTLKFCYPTRMAQNS